MSAGNDIITDYNQESDILQMLENTTIQTDSSGNVQLKSGNNTTTLQNTNDFVAYITTTTGTGDDAKTTAKFYTSLAEAITAAGTNETTITLIRGVGLGNDTTVTITENANITLDLNGNRIQTATYPSSNPAIEVKGTLTIKDSGTNGEISSLRNNKDSDTIVVSGGKLNVESGQVTHNSNSGYAIDVNGGTVNIGKTNGGTTPTISGGAAALHITAPRLSLSTAARSVSLTGARMRMRLPS